MAERVARVKIQATADLKGFDEASKALRDLQRAVGPADAEIAKVRQEILNFAEANKRSEAVISAQINALKQLKQQASLGGSVYKDLSSDVDRLKRTLGETGSAFQGTARSINDIGKATQATQIYINNQTKSFEAMRKQAVDTINTLQNLGQQADRLKAKGGQINFFSGGGRGAGGVFEVGRKGLADIQAYAALVKRLQDQAQTATGKVARLSEGMFALGATGVGIKGVVDSLGGVSGALEAVSSFTGRASAAFAQLGAGTPQWAGMIKGGLNEIALLLNQPANGIANWSQSLAGVQAKLATLSVPLEAFNNAIAAIGPEGAAAAGVVAVAFAGLQDAISRAFKEGERDASQALQGITDETQQLLRKLAELSQAFRSAASMNELRALQAGGMARFNETPAGTDASRRAANTIASAEARIRAEAMAQADVLEAARQKYRGSAQDVTSLSERLAYLNQAMKQVDQTTSEGSIEYARFASEAEQVKQQIDKLASSYRTVAQAAKDAAQAQGVYANQSTVSNYFNRAAARRNEEIAAAARAALSAPRTLALPAAGQSSFSGTFNEALGIGGGARLGSGQGERPFEMGSDPAGKARFLGTRSDFEAESTLEFLRRQNEATKQVAASANTAESELMQLYRAMQQMAQSQIDKKIQQTGLSYQDLAKEIDRVSRASDGSINSLRQQRQLWEQLYNAVERTDPAYRQAARNIARLDQQLERTQLGGMQGKVGYIAQGIGAAASAGIFGGPEGLIGGIGGGLAGLALGGPAGFAAGAFTGSSIGAYAGMGRQSLGQFTEYAAQLEKQRIALRDVAGSAAEYERALRATATASAQFNVPIGEVTQGFTQLGASVVGAGGKIADAELVYKNITAAIKATGGGAEQVQGAMTALSQIFSKGKVSAEELSGQLGERLPGAVTLFAQATGRSLPQLQKDLEQGTVGLNDVMKFVISLGEKYTATAQKIAQSDVDAGQRFQKTFADLRAAVGRELAPLGAELQNAFGNFLKEITPALIATAKNLASAIRAIVENAGAIANLVKFAAQMGAISLAIKAFIAVRPAVISTFAAFQLGGAQAAASAALATPKVVALGAALKSLTVLGIITVGVNVIVKGIEQVRQVRAELKALRDYNPNQVFAGATRETVQGAVKQARGDLKKFQGELKELQGNYWKTLIPGATLFGAGTGDFLAQKKLLETRIARAQKTINELDPLKFPTELEVQREELRKLQQELSKFADPTGGKDGSKEASDKARREAEQRAAEQQRLNEANAQAQIRLSESVFRSQIELDRRRFELQQEYIEKERQLRVAALTGVAAETASSTAQFFRTIDELRRRVVTASQDAAAAARTLSNAQYMQSVTGGAAGGTLRSTGVIARTGSTGDSTGPHLDARWADGRRITAADADRYLMVNGRSPSSFGVTSPYGPRRLFGRTFHSGIDFGTPAGSGITLRNGASLLRDLGFTGSGGYAVEIMTPEGPMRLLHLQGSSVAGQRPAAGVAAQQRRNAADQGDTAIAQVDLQTAREYSSLLEQMTQKRLPQEVQLFALEGTKAYREQTQALRDSVAEFQKRQELELSGARQEVVDGEMQKLKLTQDYTRTIAELNYQLEQKEVQEDPIKAEGVRARIEATTQAYQGQKQAIDEATQAQIRFNDAMRFRQDMRVGEGFTEGLRQYVEGIGTLKDATTQLTLTGVKGLEDALLSLVTTGTANFREFAASILRDTARMIIQQFVLRSLMQAIGAIGGGGGGGGGGLNIADMKLYGGFAKGGAFAQNGIQPFAMGGIVDKPTLFKFANGGAGQLGLMGEAGPEAIMPLRRGRDGKLGVAAAGGAPVTVNVSVDASGSQVQGDAGQGAQLGRAIAGAVQQELIRQKRPGGLLAA